MLLLHDLDALSFPTSSASNSPPPSQHHSANVLQFHHQPRSMEVTLGSMKHSPASSSIADSSSGKLPVTPRDGSELVWNARQRSVTIASSASSGVVGRREHSQASSSSKRVWKSGDQRVT